ncbi:MAG: hypothetical protein WD895_01905 [Acidimicrobiia bacterium]
MSRFDDYEDEMLTSTLSDQDIERLLSGARPESDEASRFVVFIDLIRAEGAYAPSETVLARVATEAAKLARTTSSPSVVADPRPQGRWAGLRFRPQLAVAAVAVLLLCGATGVAVAANSAAPGDFLYGIDRALEKIGIGAGHGQERLDEAIVLLSEGKVRQALKQAAQALDEAAGAAGGFDDLEAARVALVEAAGRLPETSPGDVSELLVRDNVSTLLDYLRENLGKRVGADGNEFGQGVADLARGITSEGDEADPTPKPAEDNGKNDDGVGGPLEGAPGNGDGGENGEGNGPPDESPSGTAPDQGEKP